MRTTAAGGTGNTPPGTGCKPGAVERHTRGDVKDGSSQEEESGAAARRRPHPETPRRRLRTGEVTRLVRDHLISVGFGVLGFAVGFVLQCGRGGRHHSLWEQC